MASLRLGPWLDRTLTAASLVAVTVVAFRYLGPRGGDPLGELQGAAVLPPGQVALVELGATHCPSCVAMTPTLELLKRTYAGRAEVRTFYIDRPEDRPAVEPLARLAHLRYTPTFLVVGRDGRATAKFIGPASYVALAGALDEALKAKHP